MSIKFFEEIKQIFEFLKEEDDLRCILLTGNGKMFTSGLDLVDAQGNLTGEGEDSARKAIRFYKLILKW